MRLYCCRGTFVAQFQKIMRGLLAILNKDIFSIFEMRLFLLLSTPIISLRKNVDDVITFVVRCIVFEF